MSDTLNMDTGTLVIDTSYGSTVGVMGGDPVVETNSRTHVERLQIDIAAAMDAAPGHSMGPGDIHDIVVGTGPAPFTGLRAGIVTAKALAYATGARLTGQDVLEPLARWMNIRQARERDGDERADTARFCTLAVNDARRRQLYFRLYEGSPDDTARCVPLCDMDIADPDDIVRRINGITRGLRSGSPDRAAPIRVHVLGRGSSRYERAWHAMNGCGEVRDESIMQLEDGIGVFAACAASHRAAGETCPAGPLYLRRPDVSVPNPLKHVLNHGDARKAQ